MKVVDHPKWRKSSEANREAFSAKWPGKTGKEQSSSWTSMADAERIAKKHGEGAYIVRGWFGCFL